MLNKILKILPQKEDSPDSESYTPALRYIYADKNTSLPGIYEELLNWKKNEQGWEVVSWSEADSFAIQYRPEARLKSTLGLQDTFFLTVAYEPAEAQLVYSIAQVEGKGVSRMQSPSDFPKLRKSGWFAEGYADQITEHLQEEVWKQFLATQKPFNPEEKTSAKGSLVLPGGRYVGQGWGQAENIFWHLQRQPDEILLAALKIGAVKNWPDTEDVPQEADWWYVVSSHRTGWLGREKDGQMHFLEQRHLRLEPEKGIGRDTIRSGYFVWEATGTSERYFHEIKEAVAIVDAPLLRIREFARLNWHHKVQHEASNRFAQLLLAYLVAASGNPIDRVALFYTDYAQTDRKNALSKAQGFTSSRLKMLEDLLFLPDVSAVFRNWTKGWYVSPKDQLALLHLLLLGPGKRPDLPYGQLLEVHRELRDAFLSKEKDLVGKVWVELEFCRHLIWAGETREAIQTLEETREVLPDEGLTDLLPPEDLELKNSGQVLRIQLLELLIEAKGDKNAKQELAEVARLQPLVPMRAERWLEVAKKSQREQAQQLALTLRPEGLQPPAETEETTQYFNTLPEKLLKKEVTHPAAQEKSIRQTLQSWIAEAPKPDTASLKAFAQELSEQEHAVVRQQLTDIRQALGMPAVKCYVAHGQKRVGIRSYQDKPSFLVIGAEHLKSDTPFALRPKEWLFALGSEMAHLRFGHVRITADDLWEGAKEKGFFALDTLLSVLPGLSSVGAAMKSVPQLNRFSDLLQKTSRLQQIADSSQNLIQMTGTAVALVSGGGSEKPSTEDVQQQQLLATSRMMQLSADRAGLLLCGDLKSAVRAIFLTSPLYQPELDIALKYGLPTLLEKRDENGKLRFQELAIRLAALFSFYASEEFVLLRQQLVRQ